MGTTIALVILLGMFIAVLVVRRDRAFSVSVGAALLYPLLVVIEVLEAPVRGVAFGGLVVVIAVGSVRSRVRLSPPPLLVGLWISFMGVVMTVDSTELLQVLLDVVTFVFLFLLAAAWASLKTGTVGVLMRVLQLFVVAQLVFAVGEAFLGGQALWPRRNLTTFRLVAYNNLWPDLGVRAMGTTGYALTLGVLAAFCTMFFIWFAVTRHDRVAWMYAAGSAFVLVLSGSRTPLLALVAALLFWAASKWRTVGGLFASIAAIVGGVFLLTQPALLGLVGIGSDFDSERSFVHRSGVLETSLGLMGRPLGAAVFGGGQSAVIDAFDGGYVRGVAGLTVFDNEYPRTLAAFGFLGFALLILVLLRAIFRCSAPWSVLAVVVAVSSAGYDTVTWYSILCLMIVVVSAPAGRRARHIKSGRETVVHSRGQFSARAVV